MSDGTFKKSVFAVFVVLIVGTVLIFGAGVWKRMEEQKAGLDHSLKVLDYCYKVYSTQADIDRCVASGYAP